MGSRYVCHAGFKVFNYLFAAEITNILHVGLLSSIKLSTKGLKMAILLVSAVPGV